MKSSIKIVLLGCVLGTRLFGSPCTNAITSIGLPIRTHNLVSKEEASRIMSLPCSKGLPILPNRVPVRSESSAWQVNTSCSQDSRNRLASPIPHGIMPTRSIPATKPTKPQESDPVFDNYKARLEAAGYRLSPGQPRLIGK